jgi:transposase/ribosomal protein S27AE
MPHLSVCGTSNDPVVDKALLEGCLAEGMSLEAIGKRVGKHESTVSYWLKKHGLAAVGRAVHAPNGKIDPERLRALVKEGASVERMADEFRAGRSTIRYWLQKLGLETERSTRLRESKAACAGGARRTYMRCPKHGLAVFVARADGRFRCGQCRAAAVTKRRRALKRILVEEAGGKCTLCGYSRCHRALEFHHLDPKAKEFELGRRGLTLSLARLRAEAKKCALLCSNCHAEVEAGIAAVPLNSVPDADPG